MIEFAKLISEKSLSIFESIFTDKLSEFCDQKSTIAYFNNFDDSIISTIEHQIKDQYESEKLKDFILKNPLLSEQKYKFITENDKINFIDQFYKKNPDLKYIGSQRINHCLESYIDKINELLNSVLSTENKILLKQITSSTTTILEEIQDNKREIKDLKEVVLSNQNTEKHLPTVAFYNISRKNNLFHGRTKIIEKIFANLSTDKLTFLTGAGGMGKSQIACEIIQRSRDKYKLILWFSANSESDLLEEFNNAAIYYNLIKEKSNQFEYILTILSAFINRYSESLIIFDGVDDISIEFLAQNCLFSNSDIIVTTQNSNIDPDEFPVIPIGVFEPEESISFLLNNSNGRKQTKTDREMAFTLSNLLENFPLALEYARAYVNKMHISFTEYYEIYKENKQDILNSTTTNYKKTAYTAWQISFQKILQQSPQAKNVLNIISFFDSFNIPIYDIFLFKKQYSSFELNRIISAITSYSLFTVNNNVANTHSITQGFIRSQMKTDCTYDKYFKKALQILSELMPLKITNAHERDLVNRISKHALKLVSYNCNIDNEDIIYFSANIASKLYTLGNYMEVINFVNEQIQLYEHSKQKFKIYEMVIFSIQSYHYTGNDTAALNLLAKYITIIDSSESLTDLQKWYLLSNYKNIEGIIQKDQGNLELSIKIFLEALTFQNNLGSYSDSELQINILTNIGNTLRHLNRLNDALDYYQQAISYSNNDKHQLLRIYGNIGLTYKRLENYDLALNYFLPALDYSIELGDKRNECIGLQHLGNCYICMHNYEKAMPYLEQSLKIANHINFITGKINVYFDYGSIEAQHQNYESAKQYWELCLEMSTTINYHQGISLSKHALSSLPEI